MVFQKILKKYGKTKVILATVLVLVGANTYFTLAATLKLPPSNLGLVGYWSMDEGSGTLAKDSSGNKNNGTLTGSPNWATGKLGNALSFTGSNYVEFSNSSSLSVSGNQITVSVWVKPTAGDYRTILSKGYSSSDGGYAIRMSRDSEPTKAFFQVYNSSGTIGSAGTYSNIKNGVWSHLIGTYDGSQVCFYVNGVLDGACGALTGNIKTNSLPVRLGKLSTSGGTTEFYVGLIDDARVYNRAISATEIKQLYQSGNAKMNTSSTNKNTSGLVGYWTFDGADTTTTTATDKSGSGNNGTLTNGPIMVSGKTGQALKFDGVNDVVTMPVGTEDFGSGDFTISLWTKFGKSLYSWQRLFGKKGVAAANVGYSIYYGGDTSKLMWSTADGTTAMEKWTVSSFTTNVWHHVVMVRNSSDPKIGYFFVDGVRYELASTPTVVNTFSASVQPSVGALPGGSGLNFDGYVDDIRTYNRALSATEIKQLYNTGVGTQVNSAQVNTPSSSLTTGLVGYWPFNGIDVSTTTAFDRSTGGNNGTLTNGPTVAIGKIGQALNFDGINDYVDVNLHLLDNACTGSISLWVKRTGAWSEAYNTILTKSSGAGWVNNHIQISRNSTSDNISFTISDNTNSTQASVLSGVIAIQKWYHLEMTWDGSTLIGYTNGVETGRVSSSICVANNSTRFSFGRGAVGTNRFFNGSIDDIRIYNRAHSPAEVKKLYLLGN